VNPARSSALAVCWLGAALLALVAAMSLLDAALAQGCTRPLSTALFQLGGYDAVRDLLTGPCGAERAHAADWVNRADLFIFFPVYLAFLTLAAHMLAQRWVGVLPLLAIALAGAAALADWIETARQLGVSDWVAMHRGWDFEPMRQEVAGILAAARLKYILLCANGAVLALICWVRQPRPWRFTGAALMVPVLGVSAVMDDAEGRAFLLYASFAISWSALTWAGFRIAREKDLPPSSETPRDVPMPWREQSEARNAPGE
jgi:hypothetical protein